MDIDSWQLGGRRFESRLIIGTGKYKDNDETRAAIVASGAEMVDTCNPGCLLQISAIARQRTLPLQVVHPVELLLPDSPVQP